MNHKPKLSANYEDLDDLREITPEEMERDLGGVSSPVQPTTIMEHRLQADYKKYDIGNTDYTAKQLDHQLLTAVSSYQECGVSAEGHESEIVKYVEATDGITLGKQIGELEHGIQTETNSLVTGGFASNSQVFKAICEVETLAEHDASQLGYLTQKAEQSIMQTVNNDTGISKSIQAAEIAITADGQQAWAHSYVQGDMESFGQLSTDAIKAVSAFNIKGPLTADQVESALKEVEENSGIAQAVDEKNAVAQVMADYVKYDAFNQEHATLQSADFRGMMQQDMAAAGDNPQALSNVMQEMEFQSGAAQAKLEYDTIKAAIETQLSTSTERNTFEEHPNLLRNELSADALAIESQESGLTVTSLENQVRRAYENNNGIAYEMVLNQIHNDIAPINLGNGELMNLTASQNEVVDTELQSQVEHVISANNLSVSSNRASQIQYIAQEVEQEDGITAALQRNNAFQEESSKNPFESLQGVEDLDKPLGIFADVTLGLVEIATAAAGAGAIVAGAAGAAAAGAEVAADTAEAVEVAATGARVAETVVEAGAQPVEETPQVAGMAARVEAMTADAATLRDPVSEFMGGELIPYSQDVDYFPSLVDRPVPPNAFPVTPPVVQPVAGEVIYGLLEGGVKVGGTVGAIVGVDELSKALSDE